MPWIVPAHALERLQNVDNRYADEEFSMKKSTRSMDYEGCCSDIADGEMDGPGPRPGDRLPAFTDPHREPCQCLDWLTHRLFCKRGNPSQQGPGKIFAQFVERGTEAGQ